MLFRVCLTVLCVSAVLPARGADENLISKRPCSYFPAPDYYQCKDKDDPKQLTDGYSNNGGSMWVNKPTVGWASGVDVPIVMLFDLGQQSTVNELRFSTSGGGGAGVVEVGLQIFVSLDNKSYVPAGRHVAPKPRAGQNERYGVQIKVPLAGARARYVAIAAMAPAPFYFVFVDEVEIYGKRPADAASQLPVQSALTASGAKGLQELLAGGERAGKLMEYLTGPVVQHTQNWPKDHAEAQLRDVQAARKRAFTDSKNYGKIRAELTTRHRDRAREVYGRDTLVWETVPDEASTMLSMPLSIDPNPTASVHTAINALEATALGVANLTNQPQALNSTISGKHRDGPKITPRVGRYCLTTNARYVPDPLILTERTHIDPVRRITACVAECRIDGIKGGNL